MADSAWAVLSIIKWITVGLFALFFLWSVMYSLWSAMHIAGIPEGLRPEATWNRGTLGGILTEVYFDQRGSAVGQLLVVIAWTVAERIVPWDWARVVVSLSAVWLLMGYMVALGRTLLYLLGGPTTFAMSLAIFITVLTTVAERTVAMALLDVVWR